jgi:hypothetical protein
MRRSTQHQLPKLWFGLKQLVFLLTGISNQFQRFDY